ncbi:hypothetical protein MTBBW1_800005 [Desulfamplus magnetovallimortis]|uniref:Uncharacterized protein n=1 Tax=Desulfamplus magnetovallimortis TaxID=1246637 RepID=A0A1W1HKD3_9BACT|nr:hypothetical protein MTBBW1_800005 [Desulfamplus magnetovallimortis]
MFFLCKGKHKEIRREMGEDIDFQINNVHVRPPDMTVIGSGCHRLKVSSNFFKSNVPK